jgi:6-phosphofructokinase 1
MNLIVGQSGGCTHVINASLLGVIEEARRHKEIKSVWGARHGIEGVLAKDFVNLGRLSSETARRLGRTPAAALGSCRHKLTDDEADKALAIMRRKGVRLFIYIGGNDSADTGHRMAQAAARAEYDLRVISVPKTIDNDLPVTDHTPGYGSAARFLAFMAADVGMETAAMRTVEPVKIIEVMGRNAGWLAAASALAKRDERDAPQLVWPPEIPFNQRKFLSLVRRSLKGVGYCLAVVAETVRDAQGRPVAAKGHTDMDSFGHPRLIGAGEYLAELVRDKLNVRARWDKPGSIQRMSSAHFSTRDLAEARGCGAHAVRVALRGVTDSMVIMVRKPGSAYRIGYSMTPLSNIANREKLLPKAFFDRRNMLPTKAFREYALPLVGAGLPEHFRF